MSIFSGEDQNEQIHKRTNRRKDLKVALWRNDAKPAYFSRNSANISLNQLSCEGHFFAVAMSNLLKWLKLAIENDLSYKQEALRYRKDFSASKELRDMLEHEEVYSVGNGRKQQNYYINTTVNQGKLKLHKLPPFTIVHSNEGISIGTRVNIGEALDKSKALFKIISEQH